MRIVVTLGLNIDAAHAPRTSDWKGLQLFKLKTFPDQKGGRWRRYWLYTRFWKNHFLDIYVDDRAFPSFPDSVSGEI